jgi:hypothetical protein
MKNQQKERDLIIGVCNLYSHALSDEYDCIIYNIFILYTRKHVGNNRNCMRCRKKEETIVGIAKLKHPQDKSEVETALAN